MFKISNSVRLFKAIDQYHDAAAAELAIAIINENDKSIVNYNHKFKCTPLHMAVRKNYGDRKNITMIIKALVEKGADVNSIEGKMCNDDRGLLAVQAAPLHTMLFYGNWEIQKKTFELLLSLGADINVVDSQGRTPLHITILNNMTSWISSAFLEAGANPNARDKNGETPLHYVFKNVLFQWDSQKDQMIPMVKLLLNNGANPYLLDKHGCSPIDLAISQEHRTGAGPLNAKLMAPIVRTAISFMQDIEKQRKTSVDDIKKITTKEEQKNPIIEETRMIKINEYEQRFLNVAINNDVKEMDILIDLKEKGMIQLNVNITQPDKQGKEGWSALRLAAAKGHLHIVKQILALPDFDMKTHGRIALNTAYDTNQTEIVKLLMSNDKIEEIDKHRIQARIRLQKFYQDVKKYTGPDGHIKFDVKGKSFFSGNIDIFESCIYRTCINDGTLHDFNHYESLIVEMKTHFGVDLLNKQIDYVFGMKNPDPTYLIITAIKHDKTEIARRLLELGSNPNIQDYNDKTPLNLALLLGKFDIVDLLLSHQTIDINLQNSKKYTPLMSAIVSDHVNKHVFINQLLQKSPDLTLANLDGYNVLHLVAYRGELDIIKLILANATPEIVNQVDSAKGIPPIFLAIEKAGNNLNMISPWIQKGADLTIQDYLGRTALHIAVINANLNAMKLILSQNKTLIDVQTNDGLTPLMLAATLPDENGFKIFDFLLKSGANPNHVSKNTSETSLLVAVQRKHIKIVESLIVIKDLNVDHVSNNGNNALMISASQDETTYFKKILAKTTNIDAQNNNGKSALMIAVINQCKEHIDDLLYANVNLVLEDKRGLSAFMYASYLGNVSIVGMFLIKDSSLVNRLCSYNGSCTAVESAFANSKNKENIEKIVSCLINSGANIEYRLYNNGLSYLHMAAQNGLNLLINIFLSKGYDSNAKGTMDITPLHVAASAGQLETVQLLIEKKADVTLKSNFGLSAKEYAIREGHNEIADMLQSIEDNLEQKRILQSEQNIHDKQIEIQKLDNLVSCNSDDNILREQLLELQKQFSEIKLQHEKEKQIISEKSYLINGHSSIRIFYRHAQRKLTQFFLAYMVIDSGAVNRAEDKVDTGINVIQLLGSLIPLPYATEVTSAICKGAKYLHARSEGQKISLLTKMISNVTTMDNETEITARRLSFKYENQIKQLTTDGAITLAECAVLRMLEYIRGGHTNEIQPLSEQILYAIINFSSKQGMIPFTDKNVETSDKKLKKWTDKGIFQDTGIQTAEKRFYIKEINSQHELYGFRLGEIEEIKALNYIIYENPIRNQFEYNANSLQSQSSFFSGKSNRAIKSNEPTTDKEFIVNIIIHYIDQYVEAKSKKLIKSQRKERNEQIKNLKIEIELLKSNPDKTASDIKQFVSDYKEKLGFSWRGTKGSLLYQNLEQAEKAIAAKEMNREPILLTKSSS